METPEPAPVHLDAVVIGAGFSGMLMLHRLRGLGLATRVIEAGSDVGGTWYWNRYPGARCDAESQQYSYSCFPELEKEWRWSERFATQPEILAYQNFVADRLDLRRDMVFDTRVTAAEWDAAAQRWSVQTDTGASFSARFCIAALGCLSAANIPDFPGLSDYAGAKYHTGTWPHDGVDFTGKRVGVIGTGSSGVQVIPAIAESAAHLWVFQRTPAYCFPARNRKLTPEQIDYWDAHTAELRATARSHPRGLLLQPFLGVSTDFTPEQIEAEFRRRWELGGPELLYAFSDIFANRATNTLAADFVRARIRDVVKDPVLAEKLTPRSYPIGTKRPCLDTDYWKTFTLPHVRLVDLREDPISRFTASGIAVQSGEIPLDAVVFATGFDAFTGPLKAIDIAGREGIKLRDYWQDGPRAYLGLMAAQFPNLFLITGPGSPSVLGNVLLSIEQHVDYVTRIIADMRRAGRTTIEPDKSAEQAWIAHVAELVRPTLLPEADSWYMGANIPGKPRVFLAFLGGIPTYRARCDEIAANGYDGFRFDAA